MYTVSKHGQHIMATTITIIKVPKKYFYLLTFLLKTSLKAGKRGKDKNVKMFLQIWLGLVAYR